MFPLIIFYKHPRNGIKKYAFGCFITNNGNISIIKLHLEFNFKTKGIKKIKYLSNVLESTEQNNTFLKNLSFKNPKFTKVLILQIFIQINLFLQIYLQAKSLDIDINLLNNFVYNLISQISIFLSVTPNAIGIKEFILIISNNFIGLSSADVFNLAILDRLTDFLSLVVFSLFFYTFKKFNTRS